MVGIHEQVQGSTPSTGGIILGHPSYPSACLMYQYIVMQPIDSVQLYMFVF